MGVMVYNEKLSWPGAVTESLQSSPLQLGAASFRYLLSAGLSDTGNNLPMSCSAARLNKAAESTLSPYTKLLTISPRKIAKATAEARVKFLNVREIGVGKPAGLFEGKRLERSLLPLYLCAFSLLLCPSCILASVSCILSYDFSLSTRLP